MTDEVPSAETSSYKDPYEFKKPILTDFGAQEREEIMKAREQEQQDMEYLNSLLNQL